ncbi:MAG: hypothetical protein GF317_21240 [Candidatus Lokiarchaeota archaeon]|nr:hypothetical protein [Candidatus Lokiarchaeota archaeon]
MNYEIIEPSLTLEHPTVQNVLDIAQSILDENKVLNISTLYNIAKRELKISRKGLLQVIRFLINKNVLIDGSKYTKDSVLSNSYRKKIYLFIETNLGAHFSLIRKEILSSEEDKIGSSGQLLWHLKMLLKFDCIKKIKVGNYSIFIPYDLDEEIGIISFHLKDKINRDIIRLLEQKEKILQSEIYKVINENRGKVYYRISNLIENGILTSEDKDNKYISLTPDRKYKVLQTLDYIRENFNCIE